MKIANAGGNKILATDLDGTLIPSGESREDSLERQALRKLTRLSEAGDIDIVFVTGRHFESVLHVMRTEDLPVPLAIICDVGSSIFQFKNSGYEQSHSYVHHLEQLTRGIEAQSLSTVMQDRCQVVRQEEEKQTRFKLSFYCDPLKLPSSTAKIERFLAESELPFGVISSLDPFNGAGLIDVLPLGITKSSALRWWMDSQAVTHESIIFAGDSGNDWHALTSGIRAVVVGNASADLTESVRTYHKEKGSSELIYFASGRTTAGVLEGCHHFKLIDDICVPKSSEVGV